MKMSLENIGDIARQILEKAHARERETATVITLTGELGAGKTTLTQGLARALSVKESPVSPTFVIMKRYAALDGKFKQLIHIDAYRLEKSEELAKLGWQELLSDKSNLIILEWPEHVPECIPKNAIRIELSHTDDETTREIKM
jgi:tRNA threonylcarbamoyladenosine biosynthesis protein TsaE